MSAPWDPDGTFPTMPMTLPDTGQVGELLTAFEAADTGAMAQLVNAIGWLKDRAGYHALVTTDGAGGASIVWQSGDESGEDWLTAVSLGTYGAATCLVLEHATFGAASAWSVEAEIQRTSDEATLAAYAAFAEVIQDATSLDKTAIRITDDSGADLSPGSFPWRILVSLTKAATL